MTQDSNVTLCGYIVVPLDRIAAIRAALPDHIRLTRAEPGCLMFEVVPHPTRPGRFEVAETFVDKAAFDAHQARVKASEWGKITQGIQREYTVTGI